VSSGGSNGAGTRSMLRSPAVLIVGVVLTWFAFARARATIERTVQ